AITRRAHRPPRNRRSSNRAPFRTSTSKFWRSVMARSERGLGGASEDAFGAAPHERPVPRISIQAFCEFPDTGAALQRAAADRRLAKAHVTVQLGGLQAAVEHHAGNVTPNLLIVETRLQGKTAVEEIDRLADVCD